MFVQPLSGLTPGSGSQQNSQCTLNGAGSSVSASGNTLTLNLALTFLTAFAGAKNIYMQAVNPNGTAAWQLEGSWRSEEHTSELQSLRHLVCRLLLEKKKN